MPLPEVDFLTWSIGAGNNAMSQANYATNPAQAVGSSVGIADPTLYNKSQRQSAFVTSTIAMLMAAVTGNAILDDGNQNEFWKNLWETFLAVGYFPDTGAVNDWTALLPYGLDLGFDTPFAGVRVTIKVAHTITGAPNFSLAGSTPVAVIYADGSTPGAGEVLAGAMVDLSFDGASWQMVSFTPSSTRRKLTAAETFFYCNYAVTGGDTTGNGTSGSPWQTLQHAWTWVQENIDGGGNGITINQAGTDAVGLIASGPVPGCTTVGLIIAGISTTNAIGVWATEGANLSIGGTGEITGAEYDIVADKNSVLSFQGIETGACANSQVYATSGALITITGNYSTVGNAVNHWVADFGGKIYVEPPVPPGTAATLTLNGTPAYTQFAHANTNGVIIAPTETSGQGGVAFTGGATGARYLAENGGGIYTNSGGATFLPGSTGGTATSPGWYE